MNSAIGREIRLSKIFRRDGRAVIIAIDHGILMGPVEGLLDLQETATKLLKGKPDALQCTPPVASLLKENFLSRGGPALIARIDASNVWRSHPKPREGYREILFSIRDAVRTGADAVVCYFLLGYEVDSDEGRNIAAVTRVASECEDLGIPLVVEPIGIAPGYQAVRDRELIPLGVRIAFEAGADVLKVDYTGDVDSFSRAVRSVPCPLLVRGGPKTPTVLDGFQMVADAIRTGAKGVVFGRNIWQHENPGEMVMAYNELVHGSGNPEKALAMISQPP